MTFLKRRYVRIALLLAAFSTLAAVLGAGTKW